MVRIYRRQGWRSFRFVGLLQGIRNIKKFALKMMILAFKMMDFALKTMNLVFKMMNSALNMMNFAFTMMNFALKTVNAASAHYPFLRTLGVYRITGADLVAHFAAGASDGDGASSGPPPTYAVVGRTTVESLRFVETASGGGRPVDVQSVEASLDAELPHLQVVAICI